MERAQGEGRQKGQWDATSGGSACWRETSVGQAEGHSRVTLPNGMLSQNATSTCSHYPPLTAAPIRFSSDLRGRPQHKPSPPSPSNRARERSLHIFNRPSRSWPPTSCSATLLVLPFSYEPIALGLTLQLYTSAKLRPVHQLIITSTYLDALTRLAWRLEPAEACHSGASTARCGKICPLARTLAPCW